MQTKATGMTNDKEKEKIGATSNEENQQNINVLTMANEHIKNTF